MGQRKKNTDRLIKKQLLTVIQNLSSGVLLENSKREIAMVNEEFIKIFSIPLSITQLIGVDCEKYAHDFKSLFLNESEFISRISTILKENKKVKGEYLYMNDGRIISRDFSPIIINQKLEGYLWNYVDVTENAKKEEIIRINEEKYRRVLENLELGIVEVDLNNIITKAYPGFCELTGYEAKELIGKSAIELLVENEDKDFLINQTNRRKKGKTDVYEFKIRKKQGDLVWVIISGAPIYDVNNVIIGSIGIHWNNSITKQRELELVKAKESAELSSKVKKQFLANISHEIRTPINVIMGMAELLFESEVDDEKKQEINAIRVSSKNLLEIVNDLLNFSKIDSGKVELKSFEFSLHETISEGLDLFLTQIKKKGLELKYILDPKIPDVVFGDELKLKQIINNLVSNAIKFTEKGGIFVTTEMLREYEEECIIQLSFIDTGIGIKKDKHEIVFQQFMQADYDTTRKYGGTGLGLSITKELVEIMGGQINLVSDEGLGSRFIVVLPFKKSINPKLLIKETTTKVEIETFPGKKILLVEDSHLNKHLVCKILEQMQFSVVWAENGLEAIDKIQKDTFELVLMDIHMPEMDGYTATRIIRKKLNIEVPIIALTANAAKEDADKALQSGMDDYISKPFEKKELISKIKFYLEDKKKLGKEKKWVNLSYLNQLSNGDKIFTEKIIKMFLVQNKQKLTELETAIQQGHFDKIRKIAHTLKSAVRTFGIDELAESLAQIEKESDKMTKPESKSDFNFSHSFSQIVCNFTLCENELKTILTGDV